MARKTYTGIGGVHSGCFVCGTQWDTKNAVGIAARHHDATGHATWADQILIIRYGEMQPEHEISYGARPAV